MVSDAPEEGSSGVRQALKALLAGEAYVTQALRSIVDATDPRDRKAVAALEAVGALKLEEADRYFLHPGLRSYLGDHLRRRSSFETLTRISPEVRALDSLWLAAREIEESDEREVLEEQIRTKAVMVRYYMARNLEVLKELVATQYGDVVNLDRKIIQNRFYLREVKALYDELHQVDTIGRNVMDDALARGRPEVMALVMRHLISPQGEWRGRLLASQSEIHVGLTKVQRLQESLFRVAQAARWLRTNGDKDGFEVPVGSASPPALLGCEDLSPVPRADLLDNNRMMLSAFVEAAIGMPATKAPAVKKLPPPPIELVEDAEEIIYIQPCPIQKAVSDIIGHLEIVRQPVCLLSWRQERPKLHAIDPEEWLLRVDTVLTNKGYRSALDLDPALGRNDRFDLNLRYSTIIVLPKQPAYARP